MYKGLTFVPDNVNFAEYHSAAAKQIEEQTKHLQIKPSEPPPQKKKKPGLILMDLDGKSTAALTTALKELKAYLNVPVGSNFTTFFQNFGSTYPRH